MKGVLLLCVGALLLQCGYSQDACERLTLEDLGSTTAFATTGLISDILARGGDGSSMPTVRVTEMQIVCEAQHQMQNRYRYTSVVARFSCSSTDNRLSGTCTTTGTGSDATEQFDLGCDNGAWSPLILQVTDSARTQSPTATLSTEKDSGCNFCINPQHEGVTENNFNVDTITHCVDCDSTCNEGLEGCFSPLASGCCNYFSNSLCVAMCPGPLTGDNVDFECRCEELSDDNGEFSYSDGQNVGSTATLDCNDGYSESTTTAVCMESGWSATPVCNRVDCGDVNALTNGELSYSDGTYAGSVVTYMCNTEYILEGTSTRTCQNSGTWTLTAPTCTLCSDRIPFCMECQFDDNGVVTCNQCETGLVFIDGQCQAPGVVNQAATACPIGCIIAIVLSIIAVIIIAIVLAVVAFVLYKYLSDPSTKLAQAGAGGLNGVARDNPLYVDPATVTEEGIDGVENGVTETTPLDS